MAAQDAELKLRVSLDLGFFRQQLSTIGAQLGGQSIPIAIKFDKKSIADQYRLLDRYVRGKKFNVELNLVGGLTKNEFDKIKGRLDDLRSLRKVEIPIGIKNGATGQDVNKTVASIKERIASNQQIKQGGGKLRIETSIKPSVTNEDIANLKKAAKDKLSKIGALEIATKLEVPKVEDLLKGLQKNFNRQKPLLAKTSIKPSILRANVQAFKKTVEEKLSGISVKINAEIGTVSGGKTKAQIEKEALAGWERIQQMGAERMGGVSEAARRESLKQSLSGRNIGELKDIGSQLGVGGVSRFKNTQNLIQKIVTEASVEMITKYLDPQAVMRNPDRSGLNKVLDTFARGLFGMLGMDVASMRQQMAERRALPGINFPATVPPRSVSIGPSSTGRALPPGATREALPGTAFGSQRYLPTALGDEMKRVLREAANAFLDTIRAEVRKVNVRDIGAAVSRQPLLGPGSIAGMLPAAVGREPSRYAMGGESREQMMARRTAEAYARSALRGVDAMGGGAGRPSAPYSYAYRSARPTSAIVPYATGGAIVPSPSNAGGAGIPPSSGSGGSSGGMGGLGNFARAMGGINLPGAGVINELGQEFGFATKQVLLFGQAYKLLGFLQSFPGEVGAAVGALQSYRNTLDAVTPSAEEARASNELLLGLMDKYNIPLQSARDGFTKLYASMAPAGFSGDEIRGLFTGISKAAATFGMSADKVDRVNYAFAQMASKGQVMSEELKGQLGDVLPGSMALFAKAAGFEGPKAIQDFSVALEAGTYKGDAMVALLKNVTTVMNKEFGPGAEGAALTFQGIMSRMQNSVTLLYESFEPVAVGFLNTVVVPLTSGIKQVTDGISAFMSGTAAKTSGGFALAQELEKLRPAFSGIGQNVAALVTQLSQFANVALQVGKVFLQIAGNPFVGYLARVYVNILALTTAIQLLNLRALIPMIASFGRSVFALITFTAQCVRAGQAVQVTGLMMRTFFATTGVGLLVLGIGLLTEKFMSMNQALADTRAKALGAADAIRSMSSVEARAAEQGAQSAYRTIGTIAGRAGEKVQGRGNERLIEISAQELKQLESIGSLQTAKDPITGRITARRSDILSLAPQAQRLQAQASGRISDLRFEEKQAQQQAALMPIPPGEGDTKGLKKAQSDAETLAKQEQQRAIELQNQKNKIAEIGFQKELAMSDDAFEHHKSLIDAKNEYELSGLNDIQARQKKFAQDLEKIQLERIATVRKAQDEMAKANFEATTAAATAQAAGGTDVPTAGAMVDKSVLRNWLISQGFGRTTGDFTNAGHQTPNHMLNAMDMGILGGSDADALRKTADMEKKLRATGAFGNQLFGPISDPYGHGAGKGGSNIHLHIPTPGGKFKMTSGLAGLMGGKQSSAAFSMETKAQKETFDLQQAQASKSAAQEKAALQIRNAAQLAIEKTATLIKTNIDSIYPIEQQKLENQLMKIRNDLQLQGMPSELISYEESKTKAQMEGALALDVMNKNLAASEAELTNYEDLIKKGAKADSTMTMEMVRLRGEITNYKAAIAEMPAKQKELNIAMLEGAIAAMKNADALKAMEETSGRINDAVEGVTGTYKSLFKELAMGADSVDALKKAQQALADQALTMVFDFAMKPMEEFMKNTLSKMFGVPTEKEKREESIKKMEEQLTQLKFIEANTAITAGKAPASGTVPAPPVSPAPGQTTAAGATGGFLTGPVALQTLPFNGQTGGMLQTLPFNGESGFLSAIGIDSEALSTSITDSANVYSEQLSKVDTSVLESATALSTAGTELGKEGAAGKKWHESLGQAVGGLGMAAGSIMGIAAGINQIKEGGTSNVLGGIGMIASMAGSLLGSFSSLGGLFSGGGGGGVGAGLAKAPLQPKISAVFANGGVARGGFRAFANGGVVGGPTLGLMGEGKYNEAIVPLPDGKSIPVQLGGRSARDLMGGGAPGMPQAPSLSMNFETTKINGVEYVSRDQLEQAMAETRRASIAGGARQGMSMTLDKIKQSPSTRSRIGMR